MSLTNYDNNPYYIDTCIYNDNGWYPVVCRIICTAAPTIRRIIAQSLHYFGPSDIDIKPNVAFDVDHD